MVYLGTGIEYLVRDLQNEATSAKLQEYIC